MTTIIIYNSTERILQKLSMSSGRHIHCIVLRIKAPLLFALQSLQRIKTVPPVNAAPGNGQY